MRGLRTARVVVVDDNFDEAGPLLEALGSLGIGAVYYDGDVDRFPAQPLTGVRLLFVDMDLTGSPEVATMVSTLLGVLKKVIADKNGPVALVAWTKHVEVVDVFETRLRADRPTIFPLFVARLAKADVLDGAGGYDVAALVTRIEGLFTQLFPIDALLDWEQRAHDAASDTTASLAALAEGDDWEQRLTSVLAALIRSGLSIDPDPVTPSEARMALHGALTPLHTDSLDSSSEALAYADDLSRRVQTGATALNTQQSGQVNRRLLIARAPKNGWPAMPGTIYCQAKWKKTHGGMFPVGSPVGALATDVTRAIGRRLLNDGDLPFVLVEITPPCDWAQGRMSYARLVPGLLVPEGIVDHISTSPGVKRLGPLSLEPEDDLGVGGVQHLALTAAYVFGWRIDNLRKQVGVARLRDAALADVQTWFATQAARTGFRTVTN